MIKMSNKLMGVIAGSSAVLIAGTTIAVNILLKNENGDTPIINPLNRDRSYHYYSLINKLSTNTCLSNLITIVKTETGIAYIIEENRFLNNIKTIVQDTLKQIPAFAENYLSYVIDCHYKINTKSVLVDLVWYLPEAKNKFFDQFELILQTT